MWPKSSWHGVLGLFRLLFFFVVLAELTFSLLWSTAGRPRRKCDGAPCPATPKKQSSVTQRRSAESPCNPAIVASVAAPCCLPSPSRKPFTVPKLSGSYMAMRYREGLPGQDDGPSTESCDCNCFRNDSNARLGANYKLQVQSREE